MSGRRSPARPRSGGRRGGRLRPVGGRCPADPCWGSWACPPTPATPPDGPGMTGDGWQGTTTAARTRGRPAASPRAMRGALRLLRPGAGRAIAGVRAGAGSAGPAVAHRRPRVVAAAAGSWPGRRSARRPWAGAAIGGRVGLADHPDVGSDVGRCAPSTRGSSSGRPPCSPSGGEAVEGWSGTPSQARIWSRQRSSR